MSEDTEQTDGTDEQTNKTPLIRFDGLIAIGERGYVVVETSDDIPLYDDGVATSRVPAGQYLAGDDCIYALVPRGDPDEIAAQVAEAVRHPGDGRILDDGTVTYEVDYSKVVTHGVPERSVKAVVDMRPVNTAGGQRVSLAKLINDAMESIARRRAADAQAAIDNAMKAGDIQAARDMYADLHQISPDEVDPKDIGVAISAPLPKSISILRSALSKSVTKAKINGDTYEVNVGGSNEGKVLDYITLLGDTGIQLPKGFTPYDKAIFIRAIALYAAGRRSFTAQDIYRFLHPGEKSTGRVQPETIADIERRVMNVASVRSVVDSSQEVRGKEWPLPDGGTFTVESAQAGPHLLELMPVWLTGTSSGRNPKTGEIETYKKRYTVFQFIAPPWLYLHDSAFKQLTTVPMSLYEAFGAKTRSDEFTIPLRDELVVRVRKMRRTEPGSPLTHIRYDTLIRDARNLGDGEKVDRRQRLRYIKRINDHLDVLVEQGEIARWDELKDDAGKVYGVAITIPKPKLEWHAKKTTKKAPAKRRKTAAAKKKDAAQG